MSKKISVYVDLMESDKELDEIIDNCTPTLDKITKEAANNYEKKLLQFAIRNKAKQVYVVRKMGINIETSCWEIDCKFFTDKEVACTYAKMNKSSLTCEIIGHELWQLANIPDDVFAQIPDDGNKELAAAPSTEYRKFWALMAFAGLRYFEARDLRWKDIADGKITLVGKGGKLATVPVSNRLQNEMGTPGNPDATIVAAGTFANNTSSIRALRAAVIKAGLNPDSANNHKFRHSFISNLIRSGINVRAVQQLARHESVDITLNTYSHLLQNDLADAVNAI